VRDKGVNIKIIKIAEALKQAMKKLMPVIKMFVKINL
jgi:hypothetical protein